MARPLSQITEQAPALARDPIFAAINQYRRACTTLETTNERVDPARFAAAENELGASAEALFATVPTTRAGCRALVNFILDEAREDGEEGSWYLDGLGLLSEALARLDKPRPA